MEKRRFVSWRRVSTQKQGKSGLGLEAQESIINYFVKEADGELIADFHEVYTGKNLHGCMELQKAMEYAKKNTSLPVHPDMKVVEDFVISVNRRAIDEPSE